MDTEFEDNVICPYCGFEDQDSWEYETSGREQCPECGGHFDMEIETTVVYSTYKVDWLNEWEKYNRHKVQLIEIITRHLPVVD